MKPIEASVSDAHQLLVQRFGLDKYGIDENDLLEAFKEVWSAKPKDEKPKKPKSAYQAFAAQQRVLLKEENPGITFGQIATETSKRWKALTAEEKAAYASEAPKKPESSASPAAHKAKSKSDLLKEAESMGLDIPKSKTKKEIIEAIKEAEAEESDAESELAES
ncbi:DUF1014 domain-containing protein, partial [bacterium]|nr:DUF1014 domain-containing protein [bacterium]